MRRRRRRRKRRRRRRKRWKRDKKNCSLSESARLPDHGWPIC